MLRISSYALCLAVLGVLQNVEYYQNFFMKIGKNVTYCYCYCNYRLPSRCYGVSARKTAYFPFDIAYQIIFPHALKTVSLQPYFSRLRVLLHQL